MTLKPILSAVLALVVCREDPPGSPEKRAQLAAVGSAVAEFAKTPDEAAFHAEWQGPLFIAYSGQDAVDKAQEL